MIDKKEHPDEDGLYPANNLIPFTLSGDSINERSFEYVIDTCVDRWEISSNSTNSTTFNGRLRLEINGGDEHNFRVGDMVFLDQTATGHQGKTKVLSVPDNKTIIVDELVDSSTPISNSFNVYKLYRNRITPRPNNGLGLYDGSSVQSELVDNTFDLSHTGVLANNDMFTRVDTFYHERYLPSADFDDNFEGIFGNLGFRFTGSHDFEPGDQIVVEQTIDVRLRVDEIRTGNTTNTIVFNTTSGTHPISDITQLFTSGRIYEVSTSPYPTNNGEYELISITYDNVNDEVRFHTNGQLVPEDPSEAVINFDPPLTYEGYAQVTNTYQSGGDNIVEINKGLDDVWIWTPRIPGTMRSAESQPKTFLNTTQPTNHFIFDGAIKEKERRGWDSGEYLLLDTASSVPIDERKFLASDAPDTTRVNLDSHVTLNFAGIYLTGSTIQELNEVVLDITYDDGATSQLTYTIPTSHLEPQEYGGWSAHVGPADVTGPGSPFTSDVVYYDVYVTNENGDQVSEKRRIRLWHPEYWGDTCRPYEQKRLLFKDRFGSYQGYLFHMLIDGTLNYERTRWRDNSLKANNDSIDNRSHKRGLTDLYNDEEITLTLHSDIMDEDSFEWMRELLSSPEVYLEYWEDELIPVNINTDEVAITNDDKRNVQTIELEITLSNKEQRQRN